MTRTLSRHHSFPVLLAVLCLLATGCSGLARTDALVFPTPERDAITFWGHACSYIDVAGVGVVTDPVFRKMMIFRRHRGPVPPPSSYAGARVVVISHAHPDHLDPQSLRTFPPGTVILCPEPAAGHLEDTGHEVRVMRPGDLYEFEGGSITAVAMHHMGGRWGVAAAADGRALGYVIETPDETIFYSGDSNYFSGFSDVGWTFDPDIVLLNVNGHLAGTDAVRAAWATRARIVVPMHWGTYPYWIFGGNKRPRDEAMLERLVAERLRVLEVGQSLPLSTVSRERNALP